MKSKTDFSKCWRRPAGYQLNFGVCTMSPLSPCPAIYCRLRQQCIWRHLAAIVPLSYEIKRSVRGNVAKIGVVGMICNFWEL